MLFSSLLNTTIIMHVIFKKSIIFNPFRVFLSLQKGFERRYHTSCEIVEEC